ncbi:serine/threonine-protein kinase TBK1-like [Argonauta hians]
MMHESNTYIYEGLLGKGATASVYKGISKIDSQQYALKVFHSNHHELKNQLKNEVSILRKLNHENIVKFFHVDLEVMTGHAIIVMELLEHGTLSTQLQKPKNKFGFSEKKLLALLKDLNSGLKILHLNNIVHRDIKPSNILRSIKPDGREIYKLSDFGTAKIVEKDTEMYSIVGTEEYLHPVIYENAFINSPSTGTKDVDTWSMGVMLYQVITGKIPFETKAGFRKDRSTWFKMISQKPDDAISGFENGTDLIWSNHLPDTCKLSPPLKRKFEKVIQRLLLKSNNGLAIERYFHTLDLIFQKRDISVFRPSTGKLITYYLEETKQIPHLKDKIAKEYNIRSDDQMLFFNFIEVTGQSKPISYFLSNTKKQPLILIEKCNFYEQDPINPINNDTVLKEDNILSYASMVCSCLHTIKKELKNNVRIFDHLYKAVCILNSLIVSELRSCNEILTHCLNGKITSEVPPNLGMNEKFEFTNNSNKEYKMTKSQYKNTKDLIDELKTKKLGFDAEQMKKNNLKTVYKNAVKRFQENNSHKQEVIKNFRIWKR